MGDGAVVEVGGGAVDGGDDGVVEVGCVLHRRAYIISAYGILGGKRKS